MPSKQTTFELGSFPTCGCPEEALMPVAQWVEQSAQETTHAACHTAQQDGGWHKCHIFGLVDEGFDSHCMRARTGIGR